jgi:hypothetical protein
MRVEDDRLVVLFDEVGYKTLGIAAVTENNLLKARTPADLGKGAALSAVQGDDA